MQGVHHNPNGSREGFATTHPSIFAIHQQLEKARCASEEMVARRDLIQTRMEAMFAKVHANQDEYHKVQEDFRLVTAQLDKCQSRVAHLVGLLKAVEEGRGVAEPVHGNSGGDCASLSSQASSTADITEEELERPEGLGLANLVKNHRCPPPTSASPAK